MYSRLKKKEKTKEEISIAMPVADSQSQSSSWCHAASTDLPDPLSPPASIVHRSR